MSNQTTTHHRGHQGVNHLTRLCRSRWRKHRTKYKYDGVGNRTNRTSSVAGITNQTFVFNSNDQPTNDVFDANGNTRTNSGNTFAYDVENRLTNAVMSGTNIVIVYDGDGNRVRKIVGTTTNLYLVDDRNPTGYAQVLEEKTISGGTTNLVRLYTYGLDLISQKDTAMAFYGYDGNGNTRYLTATNAAVTDTYVYDAFGVVITNTGTTTCFYRYSGEQFDPNLGFVYLRARYLNSNAGRFLSRDSFEGQQDFPASLHKYLYGQADPIDNIDPNGHEIEAFLSVLNISVTFSQMSLPVTSIAQQRAQQVIERATTSRPSSGLFWAAYLNYNDYQQQDVWKKIGGNLGKWGGTTSSDYPNGQNSCATRVSYGLNYSGASIPKGSREAWGRNFSDQSYNGKKGDDKYYITSAGNMNTYLTRVWGAPDYNVTTAASLKDTIAGLKQDQLGIFATKNSPGHSGVLKIGYSDPYVEVELPVNVWILPVP